MKHQIPVDEEARAFDSDADGSRGDETHEVAPDITYKRLMLVNVAFYGLTGAGDGGWVLIDTGILGSAGSIRESARLRFGPDSRPARIIMTHAHFDQIAVPEHGKYVDHPTRTEDGSAYDRAA